jgi:micrococcal nuclease
MRRTVLLVFLLLIITQCQKKPLAGQVVGVSDGDTFTLLAAGDKRIRVRLYGVDAPEKGQDFSQVAKTFLSDLIFGKEVRLEEKDRDRYGRVVAIAYVGKTNVNEALLAAGLVWHYKQHDKTQSWSDLEMRAHKERRGIWSIKDPEPPWDFRRAKKKKQLEKQTF